MKETLSTCLALLLGVTLSFAAEGYLSKSASGTTTATVYFPGGPKATRIVSLDVTADNASNNLYLASATGAVSVLKAALSTATNLVVQKTTIDYPAVALLQNASEAVTAATLYTNATTTNKLISLGSPLGTNLAVSDVIRERGTIKYALPYGIGSTNSTNIIIDNFAGLASNDIIVLHRGQGPLLTNVVWGTNGTATRRTVTLRNPVPKPVTLYDYAYKVLTNQATVAGTIAANGTDVHVNSENAFTNGAVVMIRAVKGDIAIRTLGTVATTNLPVTVAAGFGLEPGDEVRLLSWSVMSNVVPAFEGDKALVVDVRAASLAANDTILVASTGYQPWVGNVAAAPTAKTIYTLTTAYPVGVVASPSAYFYEASQTALTTTFAASAADAAVICDVSTSITNNDAVYVFPATGGCFANSALAFGSDYAYTTLSFTAQIGQAMAVGDSVAALGAATIMPIGNATVRRDGNAIWAADQRLPVRLYVTGAAACRLNATAYYAP